LGNFAGSSMPLTRIQKLIGKRMSQSKRTKPCFYLTAGADVTELMALRPKLRKSLGVKVTTNAFYIRALADAVQCYPLMVGRWDGETIRIAERVNVGFAVNSPQGLVVPVVKDAAAKSLAAVARQEQLLTGKARANKLKLEDLEGETVALSNLGVYGIDSFLGIVPPRASTILAVGNVLKTACPQAGNIAVRKMVSLSLAVDHRIINGPVAAEFLRFIVNRLSSPENLL